MENQPLLAQRRPMASQVAKVALAVTLGLCAAALLSSSSSLAARRSVLVTQGIGAEEENDKMLMSALGADEGDTTKDVESMSEEAVESAEETTEEAATQEIDNALADSAEAAQVGYEADLEKYKAQEASMGHSGWAQSWARPMREAGLRAEGVALRQARFVQLYAR
ncbi:hypothetical protein T484DRAFT_1886457 [Baffinella frigidus]|nr:hypothetical protein T484DRAFT_1886457 [Cryptophyta sp. CCMP2293]|mmetsp:Transcript_6193/g.14272  ORF Transcript_6193/g.14272 Transcript_6193/m.14272 type:complete len:166 (-) Transcript_6193:68-565(-)